MRVCTIIQLKNDSPRERLISDVPAMIAVLKRYSEKSELVFRANDGFIFGHFLQTTHALRLIQSSITTCGHFLNGDSIISFEIGDAIDGHGFTRQWTWLQRTATSDRPGAS